LREYIPEESVDLIYLDPPFNSNRSCNVLFKEESGTEAEAQITAFDDAWHWGDTAERTYRELVTQAPQRVEYMIAALRDFIGTNQMMAYLVMMAALTVADLLAGERVQMPPTGVTFKQAQKVEQKPDAEQKELGLT
jgi:site-specific DNA-methyltransferase (adenine-specific)